MFVQIDCRPVAPELVPGCKLAVGRRVAPGCSCTVEDYKLEHSVADIPVWAVPNQLDG